MFEPKIYKRNGLEAFRLVGSDGSEFFYEGALDCDEKVLYKDSLGRVYYPVVTEIGSAVQYYVELDPQVTPIPITEPDTLTPATARLVNASPRSDAPLPEDIFVKPEASQEGPQELPEASLPEETPVEQAPEPATAEPAMPEPPADAPQPTPEHVKSPDAASAISAVFSAKKADVPQQPDTVAEKAPAPEAKPEEPAAPDAPARTPLRAPGQKPARDGKKRSLKWPLAIGAILVIIIAIAGGVYIVKPHTYDGLRSMLKGPTPTPVPTPEPTATPTATPTPTPAPDEYAPSLDIAELIDSDNAGVAAFAEAHINNSSAGNTLRQVCDLFDYVNQQWRYTDDYTTPRKASEITSALAGTSRDYTVLMTALLQSQGIPCRVIFSYPSDRATPDYYPEIMASNTSTGYQTAMQQLHLWYSVTTPYGHSDNAGYWISLSMGTFPGIRPADVNTEFALSGTTISQLR